MNIFLLLLGIWNAINDEQFVLSIDSQQKNNENFECKMQSN